MTSLAVIGATALYLLFIWLASAIAASWLSDRKGYGEKAGLATGLLLSAVAVVVWLVMPGSRRVALEDGGATAPSQPTGANEQSRPQARSPPTARESPVPGIERHRRWRAER